MKAYRRALSASLLLLAACTGKEAPAASSVTGALPDDSGSALVATPDTHLFDLADSTQVWMVTGREAHASGGAKCIERGIQLRKGPLKIPVPLLYTSTLPELVDGRLVARLSKDCVSGASYAIDTKTGQPTLMAPATR